MKSLRFIFGIFAFLAFTSSQAAPVLYEFGGTVGLEVRGDPIIDSFTGVNANQRLFAHGTAFSGSFFYDPDTPITPFSPNIGLAFNSLTNFSGSIDGENILDPFGSTLIENGNGVDTEDFFGTFAESPVGAPAQVTRDLVGFNRTDGQGMEFALFNVRSGFLQSGLNDFITGLSNPAILPPSEWNGGGFLALDFLRPDPNGGFDESEQHIVFFDNVFLRQVSGVPEPSTIVLMGLGLVSLAYSRKRKLST